MKEITKEYTDIKKYTVYQAADGTEFNSSDECKKYEESAKGVIMARVSKLIVKKDLNAWDLMGGWDDNTVTAFKPESQEEVDALMQLMLLENSWWSNDTMKEVVKQRYSIMIDALKNNDLILFGINCDGDYYFINSRQNIINNLTNIDKKEE